MPVAGVIRRHHTPVHSKCVCCCHITLFDYHCTQILCEVEEKATCCMPMNHSCLRNNGLNRLGLAILIPTTVEWYFQWGRLDGPTAHWSDDPLVR